MRIDDRDLVGIVTDGRDGRAVFVSQRTMMDAMKDLVEARDVIRRLLGTEYCRCRCDADLKGHPCERCQKAYQDGCQAVMGR